MINKKAEKKKYLHNRFNTKNKKFEVNSNLSQMKFVLPLKSNIQVENSQTQNVLNQLRRLSLLDSKLLSLYNKIDSNLCSYVQRNVKIKNIFKRRRFLQRMRPERHLKQFKYRNIRTTNKFITQKKFIKFFKKNNFYNNFNLRQDFPFPNYLQTNSEIQRATVFRDLINKEEAYYKSFSKSPLVILLSPKPKNIYLTVYSVPESAQGYRIYWKKSTGMLQKVEGQLSFPAVVELFNKLNIFLAKEFLYLQNPIKLIIKSPKFYGSKHLIQNFVKLMEQNMNLHSIYFMYKYRKRFNFFNNYASLINDSVFNYLTDIWLKFLRLNRRSTIPPEWKFTYTKIKTLNKFLGIKYNYKRGGRPRLDHFLRLKRYKFLKNKKYKPVKKVKSIKKINLVNLVKIVKLLKDGKQIVKLLKNGNLIKNLQVLRRAKRIKKLNKIKNIKHVSKF